MYRVKLEKFEGPMELLLELIEKEKLDITEFSLAAVADQYLEHIRLNENIHLENLADFVSVASRLILIKSRALLPSLKITPEEEEEIEDLSRQLEEYKKFKEAGVRLSQMFSSGRRTFGRESYFGVGSIFYPPREINAHDLKKAFLSILDEIPLVEVLEQEVVQEVVSLEERIGELEKSLRLRMQSSFAEIVAGSSEKIEVIVSFLAVLEMVKQRIVEVEQAELFEDIKMKIRGA